MKEAEWARHRVVAPVDGVVLDVIAKAGQFVKPGEVICQVKQAAPMRSPPQPTTDRDARQPTGHH